MTHPQYQDDFSEQVAKKERRRLRARRERTGIWYGLGMFGLIGWSVSVPIVAGILLGVWIDRTWRNDISFTLLLLLLGAILGCSVAWYWVKREGLLQYDDAAESSDEAPEHRNIQ